MMTTPLSAPAHTPRSRGTRIGRIVFLVVAALLAIGAIAGALFAWTVQRSFPQTSGTITLEGMTSQVTVQRDSQGIATITADNSTDLFFAQGFVHAQDRFFEMDFRRHTTAGRLSEMFGASQTATDAFLRTLGWRKTAEQEVENLDETTRAYYEAYADGVNAYLSSREGAELSLEYAVLGMQNPGYTPEPWEPADSVAWLKAMAWDLRSNIESETDRALLAPQLDGDITAALRELYPDYPFDTNPVIVPKISAVDPLEQTAEATPASAPAAAEAEAAQALNSIEWQQAADVIDATGMLLESPGEGIGSNSWVVSGQLTDTGMPLLANDPHLGASIPSVWHQVQLRCSTVSDACPFDVGGFSFSGLPGVVIGHNAKVAWGFTNLTTDVADLYIERVDGDQYWRDGALVPLEVTEDVIRVAGGEDVPLTIRTTVHGPIISGLTDDFTVIGDDPVVESATLGNGGEALTGETIPMPLEGDYAVSLRWTALDPGTAASAIFALNTAEDFADFRHAASLFDVPAQNLIYADTDGNIGYQTPGRLPIRGAGDGWLPQPGWLSIYDWIDFIPFEELPVSYNPASGYIVTANNAIVGEDYPQFLTYDWDYGYRAARIEHLLQRRFAAGPLTAQDMRDIQLDNEFWIGKQLAIAYDDVTVTGEGPSQALQRLRAWDAQNSADSSTAAYANVLWSTLVQNIFVKRDVPLPISGQGRLFTVVGDMLEDPESPLWTNPTIGVASMAEMLTVSAEDAYAELSELQGGTIERWNWGSLHALTLTNATLGSSGIAPIEALFNRGPYRVGGGSSVVNATGWTMGDSYATTTVPSMRMVIDLADFDASSWNHLTGTSGHAFHPNYIDQTEDWAAGIQRPWAFGGDAVAAATVDTLVLRPAR